MFLLCYCANGGGPRESAVYYICVVCFQPEQSRPTSARVSTPGPSAELQELLEKLGFLTNKHDVLEVRVDKIEVNYDSKKSE